MLCWLVVHLSNGLVKGIEIFRILLGSKGGTASSKVAKSSRPPKLWSVAWAMGPHRRQDNPPGTPKGTSLTKIRFCYRLLGQPRCPAWSGSVLTRPAPAAGEKPHSVELCSSAAFRPDSLNFGDDFVMARLWLQQLAATRAADTPVEQHRRCPPPLR